MFKDAQLFIYSILDTTTAFGILMMFYYIAREEQIRKVKRDQRAANKCSVNAVESQENDGDEFDE